MKKISCNISGVSEDWVEEIRGEYHRLEQELLKRIKMGLEPKGTRHTIARVKRAVLKFGLLKIKELNYEEFKEFCRREKI